MLNFRLYDLASTRDETQAFAPPLQPSVHIHLLGVSSGYGAYRGILRLQGFAGVTRNTKFSDRTFESRNRERASTFAHLREIFYTVMIQYRGFCGKVMVMATLDGRTPVARALSQFQWRGGRSLIRTRNLLKT